MCPVKYGKKTIDALSMAPTTAKAKVVMFDGTAKAIEGNTDAFIPPIPKPKMAMTLPIRNELIKEYFPDMLAKVKEWF